jgi:hypothetical protein
MRFVVRGRTYLVTYVQASSLQFKRLRSTHLFRVVDVTDESLVGYVDEWDPDSDVEAVRAGSDAVLRDLARQLCDPDKVDQAMVRGLVNAV